jgi:hypothetical protein
MQSLQMYSFNFVTNAVSVTNEVMQISLFDIVSNAVCADENV